MLAPVPSHEYELQAALEYTFTRLGGSRPAYGSIVGSGLNGTQLHYMKDRGETKPGDVVVIDAATEYEGYAADITRTIPVSGTYTPEQRAIYQLVRDAQAAAERNSKPGKSAAAAQDSSVAVRATRARERSAWSRARTRRSIRPGRRTASARRRRASRGCSG